MRILYKGEEIVCTLKYGDCDRPEDTIIVEAHYVFTDSPLSETEILEVEYENYTEINHEHENHWYEVLEEGDL